MSICECRQLSLQPGLSKANCWGLLLVRKKHPFPLPCTRREVLPWYITLGFIRQKEKEKLMVCHPVRHKMLSPFAPPCLQQAAGRTYIPAKPRKSHCCSPASWGIFSIAHLSSLIFHFSAGKERILSLKSKLHYTSLMPHNVQGILLLRLSALA